MASTRSREGRRKYAYASLFLAVLFCGFISSAAASPSVVNTTTGSVNWRGGTTTSLTFNHSVSGSYRVLLVGVSMDIGASTGATVSNITYAGSSLSKVAALSQSNGMRVEIWRMTNPPVGTAPVVLTATVGGGARVGIVATAVTLIGVDQTTPLGVAVTNGAASGTSATATVTASTTDLVMDTLAVANGTTVTPGTGQAQIWYQDSGTLSSDPNGSGSTKAGAASVTMTETLGTSQIWAMAAVPVKGTTTIADLAVTTTNFTPNPVTYGTNATATFSIKNNGPNAATGVTFTAPLPANVTLASATPSSGSCSGTTTVSCNIGNIANGATATVILTLTMTGVGAFSVTGTADDTQFDPPADSYATATGSGVRPCATPGKDGAGGTLTGVVNSYFAGTASAASGATSIAIGAGTGANVNIAAGDLLIVMQMQDASISSVNDERYGAGTGNAGGTTGAGSGYTALNSAGLYEFVVAQNAITFGSGGTLNIAGNGTNSGLVNAYTTAAATGTKGASTFQVIRVPQYTSATLSSTLTASPWDGSKGGVLAIDVAGTLTLGGTVSVDGLGFRGGAGRKLSGGSGAGTDYLTLATNAANGAKGEGIAGTPQYVYYAGAVVNSGLEGYPNGSMARGAPGNGAGGGTDANPASNNENTGGGGGGNGGAGGKGGSSWNSNLPVGGSGGSAFPATQARLTMGGGGGAGSTNDGSSEPNTNTTGINSSGSTGGGIVIVRAAEVVGTGTITANGADALNAGRDGGGGGGAGGTVVVVSKFGNLSGLTVNANGGKGGNAWASSPGGTCPGGTACNWHGPGGGGGGGVVLLSSPAGAMNANGGANGTTTADAVAFGATAGAAGVTSTSATLSGFTGSDAGIECAPDMSISNTGNGPYVRGNSFVYTIGVSNLGSQSSTGVVTVTDTLPPGLVATSATGSGWLCSVTAQTVACNRNDALSGASAYPSITINGTVGQTALDTVVNPATVDGGGEIYLGNDTATDTTTAASIADLSVTGTEAPDPVTAGTNVTYTQMVTNAGPSDAGGAMFATTVPSNTGFQSIIAPSGWSCSTPPVGGTGTITCTNPDLAAGASATFVMVAKVNAGVPAGTILSNVAAASSLAADPASANNAQFAATTVGAAANADVTLTNAGSPGAVAAGSNVTFSQSVTNHGTLAATTVTFSEPIPANTTFVSLTSPVGWSCSTPAVGATGTINCSVATLAVSAAANFSAVVKVNAGTPAGTIITDTATVGASNDSLSANNSASATAGVTLATQSDLSITEVATAPSIYAGNSVGFVQTIANNGPAASGTVTVNETVPAGVTFQAMVLPPGWSCTAPSGGTFTCTTSSLAVNAQATLQMNVLAPASMAGNTTITDTATVSAANGDPMTGNNSAGASTTASSADDMAVTNTGTPVPLTAGGTFTLTQVVTNNGPSDSGAATLVDLIPANTTFVSIVGAGWSCGAPSGGKVTCTIANMAAGASTTFTMALTVNAGVAAGTQISNTVSVNATSSEKIPGNNSATFTDVVASATQAELVLTAAATPAPVMAGQNITYTAALANSGPAAAANAVYTISTPPNTTFVSFTAPVGATCTTLLPGSTGTITCNATTFSAGTNASAILVVKVNSNTPNGTNITTTSTLSSGTSDPNTTNNTASTVTNVVTESDLAITNSDSPDPVIAGNNITYTQVITNNGPSDAAGLVLSETVPTNTTFQSVTPPAGWSCGAVVGGSFTCTASTLAAAGTATFTMVATVNAGTASGTRIADTASVTSSTLELNAANNSAVATSLVAIFSDADLQVATTPSAGSVAAGSNVTFTTVVTNRGPGTASAVSVTIPVPPNTTFVSSTPAGGWSCAPTLATGSTGTLTCTNSSLAPNSPATFAMVVKVNAGAAAGTTLAQTPSAATSTNDPDLTNNNSTASARVTSATTTDVAVTISGPAATPKVGNAMSYTIAVTNNGPATATAVTMSTAIPPQESYVSVSTNVGACSFSGGVVTCSLGTMANAATATITLNVTASSIGNATNTATVTENETDSNSANNTASNSLFLNSPTAVKLTSFKAATDASGRTVLEWRTKEEVRNLGFNVYREVNGEYTKLNASLIAGAAMRIRVGLPQHTASVYAWIDEQPLAGAQYWLEDVSIAGVHTWNGPAAPEGGVAAAKSRQVRSATVSDVQQQASNAGRETLTAAKANSAPGAAPVTGASTRPDRGQRPVNLASSYLAGIPAAKIGIDHEGWYRITQADLVSAGFVLPADVNALRLYAEGNEVPMRVAAGENGLTLEFYGTGIDTPYSGTRMYWLIGTPASGLRVTPASTGGNAAAIASYEATVERRDRSVYLAALTTNGEADNFFGDVIAGAPVSEHLMVDAIDRSAATTVRTTITLQGVIESASHRVLVALNGVSVGEISFGGMEQGSFDLDVPLSLFVDGDNVVMLTPEGGDDDVSAVDRITVTYPRGYMAQNDRLQFTMPGQSSTKLKGFTQPVKVFAIDSARSVPATSVHEDDGSYSASVANADVSPHTYYAYTEASTESAASVVANRPSQWSSARHEADLLIVSHRDFIPALAPLVNLRQTEGLKTQVVDVDDVYDEFNFGEHSPYALKQFVTAAGKWQTPPKYLLLVGDASVDPRNFLGAGNYDLVPTKIVATAELKTADDGWFGETDDSGVPNIAIGRLTVRTAAEAEAVIDKIVAYDTQSTGPWSSQALLVSDQELGADFGAESNKIASMLPGGMTATRVDAQTTDHDTARAQLLGALNSGSLLVNYLGHGSVDVWSGTSLLNGADVSSLTNGTQTPFVVSMECLNGFFHDVYQTSMAESFLLAANGGAAAVWASSGLTEPEPQFVMDELLMQYLFSTEPATIGEATNAAKAGASDIDVRRTWNLFGDPSMRLRMGGSAITWRQRRTSLNAARP
jgi:uncharacterized repeat protein (TIGR01451 family)